jgi:selenocysteine lyase/cysteine desulfurase
MHCQKSLFSLPSDITYLNTAYMSPMMKKLEEIGHRAISVKVRPFEFQPSDFFEPVEAVKRLFSELIDAQDPGRIALVPSVSYGMASVAKNINLRTGDEIIIAEQQFPSNVYAWQRLANEQGATIKEIPMGDHWSERILDAIGPKTRLVSMAHIHWANGTIFDLAAIREATRRHGALLVLDGTQSIGALPFSVQEFQPDALICASYKWMMGPYATGLAYYGEYFDDGIPVEESWMHRLNSDDFSGLVDYQSQYRPKAYRYSVGETSNFALLPILHHALEQILDWGVSNIQTYCAELSDRWIPHLQELGCQVNEKDLRAGHLFGVRLPGQADMAQLKMALKEENIYVSVRGNFIRVAPYVFNEDADFETLVNCIAKQL